MKGNDFWGLGDKYFGEPYNCLSQRIFRLGWNWEQKHGQRLVESLNWRNSLERPKWLYVQVLGRSQLHRENFTHLQRFFLNMQQTTGQRTLLRHSVWGQGQIQPKGLEEGVIGAHTEPSILSCSIIKENQWGAWSRGRMWSYWPLRNRALGTMGKLIEGKEPQIQINVQK